MKYKVRIMRIGQEDRALRLDLANKAYEPASSLIDDEAVHFEQFFKDQFKKVLLGEVDHCSTGGNYINVDISLHKTTITDIYGEEAGNPNFSCTVDTLKLVQAIEWWNDLVRQWTRTGKSDAIDGLTGELDL